MVRSRRYRWPLAIVFVTSLLPAFSATRAQESPEVYRIGTGDVLRIAVWKEPEFSTTVTVRPDGMISIPVAGDFQVAGRMPAEVQAQLAKAIGEFITTPSVTLIVEQINSRKVFVTGMVATPGVYDLIRPMRLMQAIALAGGTTDFAKTDRVVVLREDPVERFEISVKAITTGDRPEGNIQLRPGDTIIVP
jgi:polysaccharide export outer membrane protein